MLCAFGTKECLDEGGGGRGEEKGLSVNNGREENCARPPKHLSVPVKTKTGQMFPDDRPISTHCLSLWRKYGAKHYYVYYYQVNTTITLNEQRNQPVPINGLQTQ